MNPDSPTPFRVYTLRLGAAAVAVGVLLTPTFPQEIALLNSRAPKVVEWLDKHVGVDLRDGSAAAPPAVNTTWQQQQRIRVKVNIRVKLEDGLAVYGCGG